MLISVLSCNPLIAADARTVTPEELSKLLKKGEKVKLILKTGTYAEGRTEEVNTSSLRVMIQKSDNLAELPKSMQVVSFDKLASVTASAYKGNKRTWLPVILCSTLGTLSLVAAGATEELKSTYIPVALSFTGGLAVGGYYVGRSLDRQSITFIVK